MEKQIKELADVIEEVGEYVITGITDFFIKNRLASLKTARKIYEAGYRKQEWISVEERLPENEKEVLAYYGFDRGDGDLGMMFVGKLCYFCFDKNPHWQHSGHNLVVTHWMPLPEPPKGDAE